MEHPALDFIDFFGDLVGDPGIEPGMGHPGGVTVRCRTLQPVARSLTCVVAVVRTRGGY